ncbi:Sfi1-domain-containing protein [Xylona heveae TC161]|uniref:Sfi1-domain-containing protein n=1 Tax=Xylona heveae (strain CBS 132557 / TC161) TaxID=1328760 RepID=A0A165IQ25_XYLHT|nr:Sfi1-domain-containing protein [Xylona heveae TC161]KZF25218.1 Sfi1-domain-containing protein [Xylona heveae TC161]
MSLSPTLSTAQSTINDHSRISDQDVAILHRIVTRAQELPGAQRLPFRALFTAYEEVLIDEGLDPDYDPLYFRFLFRLGDSKLSRLSLYRKFEEALAEIGIQLEIDVEEDLKAVATTCTKPVSHYASSPENEPPLRTNRRASISSIYEKKGWNSKSSWSASSPQLSGRPHSAMSLRRTSQDSLIIGSNGTEAIWSQTSLNQFPEKFQGAFGRDDKRPGSVKATSDLATDIALSSAPRLPPAYVSQSVPRSELPLMSRSGSEFTHQAKLSNSLHPWSEGHYQRVESELIADAQYLYHHHIFVSIRRIFRNWRSKAMINQKHHHTLMATAGRRDRAVLLEAGFGHWRLALRTRQQLSETESFFTSMEQRAIRARNLFLLTKAFSHWAQCTSEELLRTSVARRHLLRAKFFNAWKDGTGINELKVRKHTLRKFFSICRQRVSKMDSIAIDANDILCSHLLRTMYWRWFWSFCEKRAPVWWAGKTKWKVLICWVKAVQERREKEGWAYGIKKQRLQRKVLHSWARRVSDIRLLHHKAHDFKDQRLMKQSLSDWALITKLRPLAEVYTRSLTCQTLNKVFRLWVKKWRMETDASKVNRLRILQSAWTVWNDNLRCKALAARTDDRLLLQALYKWVLAGRCKLQQRYTNWRLKMQTHNRLFHKQTILRARVHEKEMAFQSARNRRSLRSSLDHWRLKLQMHRQRELVTLSLSASRISKAVLQIWSSKLDHLKLIDSWAVASAFYVFSVHSLKRWENALANARKRKRREAYSYIRRKLKLRLAAKVFSAWRQRCFILCNMYVSSEKYHHKRVESSGIHILAIWKERTEHQASLVQRADSTITDYLLRRNLEHWVQRSHQMAQQVQQAEYFDTLHTSIIAAGLLRKLSLRVFEFIRWHETANSLRERNQRRHSRNILRYWAETYAGRVSQREPGAEQPKTPNGNRKSSRKPWKSSRWTVSRLIDRYDFGEFGTDANEISAITPLPGYLTTPSKRVARAKILAQTASTPLIPRSTPFPQRLKSQSALRGEPLDERILAESNLAGDEETSNDRPITIE